MEDIKEYLSYNKHTGQFFWIKPTSKNHNIRVGNIAGTVPKSRYNEYLIIVFKGKAYRAHQLAWWYEYGEFPNGILDHINRDKLDNRIENLRDVDDRINSHNVGRFNGGAYFNKEHKKWRAQIMINGKKKYLGSFDTEEGAQLAYNSIYKELQNAKFTI